MDDTIKLLQETGADLWRRGWSLGSSGSYSAVASRSPLELFITAAGANKGRLTPRDFVRLQARGVSASDAGVSPTSALHLLIAEELKNVGVILQTSSAWGTILSDLYLPVGGFELNGYEMLQHLGGIGRHESELWVEVFEPSDDMNLMKEKVRDRLRDIRLPLQYGFLVRRHGLYTWGRSVAEAARHVEILEFLFECLARQLMLPKR